jgi:hypothetical protein
MDRAAYAIRDPMKGRVDDVCKMVELTRPIAG